MTLVIQCLFFLFQLNELDSQREILNNLQFRYASPGIGIERSVGQSVIWSLVLVVSWLN